MRAKTAHTERQYMYRAGQTLDLFDGPDGYVSISAAGERLGLLASSVLHVNAPERIKALRRGILRKGSHTYIKDSVLQEYIDSLPTTLRGSSVTDQEHGFDIVLYNYEGCCSPDCLCRDPEAEQPKGIDKVRGEPRVCYCSGEEKTVHFYKMRDEVVALRNALRDYRATGSQYKDGVLRGLRIGHHGEQHAVMKWLDEIGEHELADRLQSGEHYSETETDDTGD